MISMRGSAIGAAESRSTLERAARALRAEVGDMQLRLAAVDRALAWVPAFSLMRVRTAAYRACGVQIGKGSFIIAGITLAGGGDIGSRLIIGSGCMLNGPLHFDLNAPITIGDGVSIGHHVVMITSSHDIGPASRRCGPMTALPIVIEDGAWIGAGVTLAPGVRIGRGSVVAVGSVVTADVPPNKLVGGNPARAIRALGE